MKVVTSFTHLITAEGNRIAYTYSEMDEKGNLISQNNKGNFVVTNAGIMDAIKAITKEIDSRLSEEK